MQTRTRWQGEGEIDGGAGDCPTIIFVRQCVTSREWVRVPSGV
jgi:hypothetical protein